LSFLGVRLDEETDKTLEELARLSRMSKSDIVRLALRAFIEKAYQEEEHPMFRQYLIREKAKELKRQLKEIRFMMHMRREAEYWKNYIIKVQNKEIKNPTSSKKHEVIYNASNNVLEKIKDLENQLIEVINEYEKMLEGVKVEA
jgi:hypothetical protein